MTKGHNQGKSNEENPKDKTQGRINICPIPKKIKATTKEEIPKKIQVEERKGRTVSAED